MILKNLELKEYTLEQAKKCYQSRRKKYTCESNCSSQSYNAY